MDFPEGSNMKDPRGFRGSLWSLLNSKRDFTVSLLAN
jgi:hypothetical protein